jgi:hypothetical protein
VPAAVNLGEAGNYVILAESEITNVPTSAITGDLGISPMAASFITGFALSTPPTTFTTSTQVTGDVYAPGYNQPTPANLTTAVNDMSTAFTDAAGRPACFINLAGGNIGGLTLAPGVYSWSTAVNISSDVTLSGSSTDVWILQVAQNLTLANATSVMLSGGALAQNVFWQVSGDVTFGTTSAFQGIVLGKTGISLGTGASVTGRLLAQTAVTLQQNTIVSP